MERIDDPAEFWDERSLVPRVTYGRCWRWLDGADSPRWEVWYLATGEIVTWPLSNPNRLLRLGTHPIRPGLRFWEGPGSLDVRLNGWQRLPDAKLDLGWLAARIGRGTVVITGQAGRAEDRRAA